MIKIYAKEIEKALQNKCYFTAMALSLALPDICGSAAFPDEPSSGRRYIKWCDTYLVEDERNELVQNTPHLSGEVICNLRNTFLHTGSPNIDSNKVQDEDNQLDRFILLLGDGTKIELLSARFESSIVTYRAIIIDVSWLCRIICEHALRYYWNNQEKFHFDFSVETQEHLFGSDYVKPSGDLILKVLNRKLEKSGKSKRFLENPEHNVIDFITDGFHQVMSNETQKQKLMSGQTVRNGDFRMNRTVITSSPEDATTNILFKTASVKKNKTLQMSKREAQIRSFFGQHFKEKKYKQKKEQIIQAVLSSRTRQQVNNTLMRYFSSEDVGVIYKRLMPIIRSLPGK